jgi:hypothetical protein
LDSIFTDGWDWCEYFHCWCSDVEEITEGQEYCEYDCKKELSESSALKIKIVYDENVPTPIGVFGERHSKVYNLCNNCARRVCKYIEGDVY